MKHLGWILCFALFAAHAQEVIEPAPLSVHDDGTRQIIERPAGEKPAVVQPTQPEVVHSAEALVIPNDDVVNPQGTAQEDKKSSKKKTAKKTEAAKPVQPVVAPVGPAPVVVDGQLNLDAPKDAPKEALKAPVADRPAVNIADGQLKLEAASAKSDEIKIEDKVVVIKPEAQKNEVVAIGIYQEKRSRYLQFSMGYMDSDYEAIHKSLDNGSMLTSFKFVGDLNAHIQTGFAVEIVTDKSGQDIPESIRSLQYRLFADYHAPLMQKNVKLDWVAGLSLALGDYSIKRRYLNTSGQELSVKLKEGTIVGLIPAAGIRFYLAGQNSFDLMAEYHQYFGNPQSHIGGLALSPRLNLEF